MDPSIKRGDTVQEERDYINKLSKLLFASNSNHWTKIFSIEFHRRKVK